MLWFDKRKKLDDRYKKWLEENPIAKNNSFNVITFLSDLFDEEKVEALLSDKDDSKEAILKEWQDRLGLQDWVIILRHTCKQEDLEDQYAVGETVFNNINKCAVIRIISKEVFEARKGTMLKYDFEKTLIHELLHIKFEYFQYDEPKTYEQMIFYEKQHQLIDDLARALKMAKWRETKRRDQLAVEKVKDMSINNK